jgi:putative endonuclease
VLQDKLDKSLYVGFSSNLKQRIADHLSSKGGYTRHKNNWQLIYFEGYLNKKDALSREKFLKSGSGRRYLNKQLNNFLKAL